MSLMTVARQIKHAGFVAVKRSRPVVRAGCQRVFDAYARQLSRHREYEFSAERYRRSFLVRSLGSRDDVGEMPARVFCFWTGDNEMSANRVRNLRRMQQVIGLPVELVSADSLHRWVKDDWPLHPAYEFLSLVHRSDYLRAYFLHHHGGAYCDIKEPTPRWDRVLDETAADTRIWYLGAPHRSSGHVAALPGALGADLRLWHRQVPGNLACLCRSHTPLTLEWLTEVERRLNYYLPQLREFPGGERGEAVGYPISWNRLLNQVHHPLMLKYNEYVRTDERIDVEPGDYR